MCPGVWDLPLDSDGTFVILYPGSFVLRNRLDFPNINRKLQHGISVKLGTELCVRQRRSWVKSQDCWFFPLHIRARHSCWDMLRWANICYCAPPFSGWQKTHCSKSKHCSDCSLNTVVVLYDQRWFWVYSRYSIHWECVIQRMCHETKSANAVVQWTPRTYVPQHVRKVESDISPSLPNCHNKGENPLCRDASVLCWTIEDKDLFKVWLWFVLENVW